MATYSAGKGDSGFQFDGNNSGFGVSTFPATPGADSSGKSSSSTNYAQSSTMYAQSESLRQRNYEIGLSERSAGIPLPVRTMESDPDILRCRSDALYGLQMVQIGVTGNGNVATGNLVMHTKDDTFPYVGSALLAERAHPYAGGTSSISEFKDGAPPPKLTVVGGGCSGPSGIKVEPRRNYKIIIFYEDFNTDPSSVGQTVVGEVTGTYTEANSQMTALTSVLPWNNADANGDPGGVDKRTYYGQYLEIA